MIWPSFAKAVVIEEKGHLMCGRFTLTTTADELHRRFGVHVMETLAPRWNIAPSQASLILIQSGLELSAKQAEFGLKAGPDGKRLINARAETVQVKPTFRQAYTASRCLVPASGWYEWAGKGKPFHVQLTDARVMAFAGLYFAPRQRNQRGQFVILTTAAEGELAVVHHRSPLVLPATRWQTWLTGTSAEAEVCLVPPLSRFFNLYPVALAVGDIRQDNASLVAPAEHQTDLHKSAAPQGDLFS